MNKGFMLAVFAVLFAILAYAGNFEDKTAGDFNLGTYENTSYNGNSVVLNSSNVSGAFTSRVFDAGSFVRWDNLSSEKNLSRKEYILGIDGAADVWTSSDSGMSWNLVKDDYNNGDNNGVTEIAKNSSGSLFVLFNQDIWQSLDNGITWTKVNDDYNGAEGQNGFVLGIDGNNNLIIIEGDQDVWTSSDSGATWGKASADFNGGNGNFFGIAVNSSNSIFAVDGAADVWQSVNSGVSWTLVKDDYNGANANDATDMAINNSNNLFILHAQDLWHSSDSGATWALVNDDFNGADSNNGIVMVIDSNDYIYIADGSEDIYKSVDSGVTFSLLASNMNGASGNVLAMITLLKNTNITFQVKNCSQSDCSDGAWQSADLININLTGRYFQYKAYFTSQEANLTPSLYNVSIAYTVLDNQNPGINIVSPLNNTLTNQALQEFKCNITDNQAVKNLSFFIFNSTSLIFSNSSLLTGVFNESNFSYSLPYDSAFLWGCYGEDSVGNLNSTRNFTITLDTTSPTINLALPEAKVYSSNLSIPLNFSVSDANNLGSCWYNINNGDNITLENCQNITFNVSGDRSYDVNLFANDSLGNSASASRSFSVNMQIAIALLYPQNNKWINYNNVQFNYSVSTASLLRNCTLWLEKSGNIWHLNQTNSSAIDTSGGINTFSLNLEDGSYIWNVLCTDTYNAFALNNFTLNIDSANPSLNIEHPLNNTIIKQNVSIEFNFSSSDFNLEKCWYSLDSGKTNTSINCASGNNNLSFGFINGTFDFSVYANDSAGNIGSYKTYNITIEHDTLAPSLALTEPIGAKSARTSIPLQFSASDNVDSSSELTCWYSVVYNSTGGYVSGLESVSLTNCASSSFSVPSDSDYNLNIYARDRTGNLNSSSSSFSVSTSSGGGSSSSGGSSGSSGGGGSSGGNFPILIFNKADFSIQNFILKSGETNKFSVSVKNSGTSFLNKCRIQGLGESSSWISSEDSSDLSAGQIKEFVVSLNVPENAEAKKYDIQTELSCRGYSMNKSFTVDVIEKRIGLEISGIESTKNTMKIRYSIEDFAGRNQDANVEIMLFGKNNEKIASASDVRHIEAGKKQEFESILEIPEGLEGSYNILINANSEISSSFVQEEIILGNKGLSGLAVLGEQNFSRALSIFLIVLFGVFLFFILRRIMKMRKLKNAVFSNSRTKPISDKRGYVEIPFKQEEIRKVAIKKVKLSSMSELEEILNLLREGDIILTIDTSSMKDKDELKKAVERIKKTVNAVGGDIAGFGELILATTDFAKIYRRN